MIIRLDRVLEDQHAADGGGDIGYVAWVQTVHPCRDQTIGKKLPWRGMSDFLLGRWFKRRRRSIFLLALVSSQSLRHENGV